MLCCFLARKERYLPNLHEISQVWYFGTEKKKVVLQIRRKNSFANKVKITHKTIKREKKSKLAAEKTHQKTIKTVYTVHYSHSKKKGFTTGHIKMF